TGVHVARVIQGHKRRSSKAGVIGGALQINANLVGNAAYCAVGEDGVFGNHRGGGAGGHDNARTHVGADDVPVHGVTTAIDADAHIHQAAAAASAVSSDSIVDDGIGAAALKRINARPERGNHQISLDRGRGTRTNIQATDAGIVDSVVADF